MDVKVSIIIPLYNCEKYIKKCLDSVINQTLQEIEIILVNDGSTDKTKEIAEKYEETNNKIKLINQNNMGPGEARNCGIRNAHGKYIGFVDSDDYIESTMYEKMYYEAELTSAEIVMCCYKYNQTDNIVNANILNKNTLLNRKGIIDNIISTFVLNEDYGYYVVWNKIYNKEFLDKNNLNFEMNRKHGEDWWFNIRVFDKASSFKYINYPFYYYTKVNENSITNKFRKEQLKYYVLGRRQILSIVDKYNLKTDILNERFLEEVFVYIRGVINSNLKFNEKMSVLNQITSLEDVYECKNVINNLSTFLRINIKLLIKRRLFILYILNKIR